MHIYIHISMSVCVLLGSKLLLMLKTNYAQYCFSALWGNEIARTYSSIKKSNYLLCTLSIFFEEKKYKNFLLEFDADRKLVWNANNDRT